MEPRKIIRTDIAASAIAHLMLVALIIVISEVHPFHSTPPETVAVDIVTPDQVKQEEAKAEERTQEEVQEKSPEPLPVFKLPNFDLTDKADAASKPAPAKEKAPLQKQASEQPQQKQLQPQPSQVPPQQPPPQPQPEAVQPAPAMPYPQAAPPAYRVPEPDVTVKYGVMLGLPPELPPAPKDAPKDAPRDDGGDAEDSIGAKLPPEVIAELRRHLRSCSKLPAGVTSTDAVRIRLRAVLATDGTLARPPILIEAPPSTKGVAIVKSAMSALQDCQPYKMLPVERYEEWKVMDLSFTPGDFGS